MQQLFGNNIHIGIKCRLQCYVDVVLTRNSEAVLSLVDVEWAVYVLNVE